MPTRCLTLLCRCFTALIGSDQYHAHASRCFPNHSYAGAFLSRTVPLRRKSMLCQRSSSPRLFGSLTLIAIPMLSHSMPRRIVSIPDRSYLCHSDTWLNSTVPLRLNALLCRSYTCPCQCSATPLVYYSMPSLHNSLHYYSMPKPSAPLLCPNLALSCPAQAPLVSAEPCPCSVLLRNAIA